MSDLDELLETVAAGFTGDPDAGTEAFIEDASLRENADQPPLIGREDISAYFLAFGGRREQFEVAEVVREGDRAAVRYVLRFRADAHAYEQRGIAMLQLSDGRIASWDGVWVEVDADPGSWVD